MNPRRFPPPWTVEELEACFVVRDHNGQKLAYVYFEDEPGRRLAAELLSRPMVTCLRPMIALRRSWRQPSQAEKSEEKVHVSAL